jgi:hypothetical protein
MDHGRDRTSARTDLTRVSVKFVLKERVQGCRNSSKTPFPHRSGEGNFCGDFPLTGYPPADVKSWEKIIKICQEFGLNGIRFYSWCPPEAAFTAADELSFYLQPECGMRSPFSSASVYPRMLEDETERLLKAFDTPPSFILFHRAMNRADVMRGSRRSGQPPITRAISGAFTLPAPAGANRSK